MLRAFSSAFRTPDLRKKLLFTLALIALYRFGASVPTPNTNTKAINDCLSAASAEQQEHLLADQPVLRRGAAQAVGLRAGHHALHHREHHHPAARRGHPALRAAEEGRQLRPGQADAVQPLPDHRSGHPAVHRVHRAGAVRPAVPGLHQQDPVPPGRQHPDRHGADDDGRYRRHHVARRAHHRPRCRQRHERADVHLDRGAHPVRGPGHPAERRRLRLHPDPRAGPGDHRGGRVRRAGSTAHPGAVRQTHGGQTSVRRHVHVPAVEGQPGRRHPGDLRVVAALHPAADQPAREQQQHQRLRQVGEHLPAGPAEVVLPAHLLHPDHLLRLLLRRASRSTRSSGPTT